MKPVPVTIVSKTEPTVVKQGGLWVVVVTPDAPKSRRSARVSGKIATACRRVPTQVHGNAPSGTSKEQENGPCTHVGTSKTADVPRGVHGDVPTGVHAPIPLLFDDDNRVVRWGKKAITLGEKSCCFVERLWSRGVGQVVEVHEIEEAVFALDEEDPKNLFVPPNTLKQFVKRLRKNLAGARFPYEIETVKKISEKNSILQITGFRLKIR